MKGICTNVDHPLVILSCQSVPLLSCIRYTVSNTWERSFTYEQQVYYPLANEVAKGYSNATVRPSFRPSVTSLWTL